MSAAHGTAAVSVLDAVHDPDYVTAWAATATPGPHVVEPLVHSAPERLSHDGRLDAIAAVEIAWLHAHQLTLLAALAEHPGQVEARSPARCGCPGRARPPGWRWPNSSTAG
jgi:hypothetical protein